MDIHAISMLSISGTTSPDVAENMEMEPPHRDTQPLNILDLPEDILLNIFDHLQDPNLIVNGKIDWSYHRVMLPDEWRHTIQSARLVCRSFNQFASPLLCPTVRIQLDEASINRAKKLSGNPLIASGICGIQVVLHYRSRQLTTDLQEFARVQTAGLSGVYDGFYYLATKIRPSFRYIRIAKDTDDLDQAVGPPEFKELCQAMKNCRLIKSVVNEHLGPKRKNVKNKEILKFKRIIRQSHEEYRRKYEEQRRLVLEGSFVAKVAELMSRLKRATSLEILDSIHAKRYIWYDAPKELVLDEKQLFEQMIAPHDWEDMGDHLSGELPPARILSDLPIAIHLAGVSLRCLSIGCFPSLNHLSMISPGGQKDMSSTKWADLGAACQQLESFEFKDLKLIGPRHGYDYITGTDQSYIDKYFSEVLSSQNLEVLDVDMIANSILDDAYEPWQYWTPLSSVLASTRWPRMRRLAIGYVAFRQCELEEFFKGLSDDLEMVYLRDIELRGGGSWSSSLDILREKIASRCMEGKCKLLHPFFVGGEFGGPVYLIHSSDNGTEIDRLTPERAYKYIAGITAENPCWDWKS